MLWVGTYAEKGGNGLCRIGYQGGRLSIGSAEAGIVNASWGLWSAAKGMAYFVDEQEQGRVAAWAFSGRGWEPRGSRETGGALPCYLALSPGGERLAAANYGDGTVTLFEVDPATGELGSASSHARCAGHGPNPERQQGPHAHCVVFDEAGDALFHVDLGLDRVFRHAIERGRLGETDTAFAAPPGSGPRHLLLHPDGRHALLITELSSELMLLERRPTGFSLLDAVPTCPEPCAGNSGGHLGYAPDGRVLVTNRGHDSLVAFRIDSGRLVQEGWVHTGGKSPRQFQIVEETAIVAHEGGSVSAVHLPHGGAVEPAQVRAVPGAAFIFEIPQD